MTNSTRTPSETLALLNSMELSELPMPTGLSAEMLPHEALRHLGMTDGLEIDDVIFDRGSQEWVKRVRILSIKERLDALKASASFYSAQLKAVEGTIKGDLTKMSVEEMKAKAAELLGTLNAADDEK